MEVTYLTALDYEKVEQFLEEKGIKDFDEICQILKQLEKERRAQKVSAAGLLSRADGDAHTVFQARGQKSFNANTKAIERITGMGHVSITDHDFMTLALKNTPITVEQTIIALRHSGFTIKSRRECNVTKDGFFTPVFHDEMGNIHPKNEELQRRFVEHENWLFKQYEYLISAGIPKEDARFLLPYSYNANMFMTIDVETAIELIILLTKTHLSHVQELKEFGEKLYAIAKEEFSYIIPIIETAEYRDKDEIALLIESMTQKKNYEILEKPKLLSASQNIDETILISAFMKRYQYTEEEAKAELEKCDREYFKQYIMSLKGEEIENLIPETMKAYDCTEEMARNVLMLPEWENYQKGENSFKRQLMRKIIFEGNKEELHQVNFRFQVPLSLAVLTHLTRHRTHHLLIPEFSPTIDLKQYKVPTSIARGWLKEFDEAFEKNIELYSELKKEYGISEDELVGFALSGNMVNVVTNMDAWTLAHICELRECKKSQWETQRMAGGMHQEVTQNAKALGAEIFTSLIGPTCVTQKICKEGKESCGLIKKIEKEKQYFLR